MVPACWVASQGQTGRPNDIIGRAALLMGYPMWHFPLFVQRGAHRANVSRKWGVELEEGSEAGGHP